MLPDKHEETKKKERIDEFTKYLERLMIRYECVLLPRTSIVGSVINSDIVIMAKEDVESDGGEK